MQQEKCEHCGNAITSGHAKHSGHNRKRFCDRWCRSRWRLETGKAGGAVAERLRNAGHPAYVPEAAQ